VLVQSYESMPAGGSTVYVCVIRAGRIFTYVHDNVCVCVCVCVCVFVTPGISDCRYLQCKKKKRATYVPPLKRFV